MSIHSNKLKTVFERPPLSRGDEVRPPGDPGRGRGNPPQDMLPYFLLTKERTTIGRSRTADMTMDSEAYPWCVGCLVWILPWMQKRLIALRQFGLALPVEPVCMRAWIMRTLAPRIRVAAVRQYLIHCFSFAGSFCVVCALIPKTDPRSLSFFLQLSSHTPLNQ